MSNENPPPNGSSKSKSTSFIHHFECCNGLIYEAAVGGSFVATEINGDKGEFVGKVRKL